METKEAKAYLRYVRIAPRKVQIVCDLIRGKNVATAMILKQQAPAKFSTRKYNRCKICGRPHAYLRDYGVCRICFRELAYKGEIPGVRKASF